MIHDRKIFHHTWYYFIELTLLLFGFGMLFVFGTNFDLQLITMIGILIIYNGMGIMHHKIHHDLHLKIVVEYILISVLVMAAFIFLNITRL